jgi:hypothetical protein
MSDVSISEEELALLAEIEEPVKAERVAAVKAEAKTEAKTEAPPAFKIDPSQLAVDISINQTDLDGGMVNQAGLFARYAWTSAQAQAQHEKLKASFEILESMLDGIHREALATAGGKVTEAMIRQAVVSDKRWGAAQIRLIDARTNSSFSKDVLESFKQKRDMLVQLAISDREEMKGTLRVMDTEERDDKRKKLADKLNGV